MLQVWTYELALHMIPHRSSREDSPLATFLRGMKVPEGGGVSLGGGVSWNGFDSGNGGLNGRGMADCAARRFPSTTSTVTDSSAQKPTTG